MPKYQRWYDEIIERARDRSLDCYCEVHHVLPRALGGFDSPTNLVRLTYREHFLAHWLLSKIYDGHARRVMIYALHCMTWTVHGRIVAGWQVEVAKRSVKAAALKRKEERRAIARERHLILRGEGEMASRLAPLLDPAKTKDRARLAALARDFVASRNMRLFHKHRRKQKRAL